MKNTRGVSPLVATILLIAFAMALATVIMQWGLSLDIGKSEDPCDEVEIVFRAASEHDVCFVAEKEADSIFFTIDNEGKTTITELQIIISGNKNDFLTTIKELTVIGGGFFDSTPDPPKYNRLENGHIQSITIIPKILAEGKIKSCQDQLLQTENVKTC